ncbi:ABC transporter substrate-binding protein [Bradyrhizobium sp. NAS80.1]|uniref:ABC transporter substrate-binding protein n=1 Tax=Bradyrhizobium sp. NAS80.1 TaxID=1680159 RepID=UPI00143D093C|nr:ABC transporter substrate-binding protein [Bradyrhizobium sp. NAS80.1]
MWAPISTTFAQQVKRIAIIAAAVPVDQILSYPFFRVFFEELSRQGFAIGQNLAADLYSGKGQVREYASVARTVVATRPDVIFTSHGTIAAELEALTSDIPILAFSSDPFALGHRVASLARPRSNFTGVATDAGVEIQGKRLSLLLEAKPNASRVGFIASLRTWGRGNGSAIREAAQMEHVTLLHVNLGDALDQNAYTAALDVAGTASLDAMVVSDEAEHLSNMTSLVNGVAALRVPAMYPFRDIVVAGGLMAYHVDQLALSRYAAGQAAQILRGKSPGDIPIYQPTEFRFLINTKAAQQIGLHLPPALLARADEVIE